MSVASENNGGSAAARLASFPEGSQRATVAAGCFWGVEHMFRKAFDGKGLLDAKVGYIGGDEKNPTYRSICNGRTGRMYHHDPILVGRRRCGGFTCH